MPVPAGLPSGRELIDLARAAMSGVRAAPDDPAGAAQKRRAAASRELDKWAPDIDVIVDLAGAAELLGLKGPDSIRRRTFRVRADGTPDWPEPDQKLGRSKGWKIRTIVLHQAEAPGHGHPGMKRRPYKPRNQQP